MAAEAFPNPESDGAYGSAVEFLDNQGGRRVAVHVEGAFGALDDDADMELFVTVGFRNCRRFVFARVFGTMFVPGPSLMRDVLHRSGTSRMDFRPEVQGAEVDGVVSLGSLNAEGDAEETALDGLAVAEQVGVKCAVLNPKPSSQTMPMPGRSLNFGLVCP